jgi:hypothetical protein
MRNPSDSPRRHWRHRVRVQASIPSRDVARYSYDCRDIRSADRKMHGRRLKLRFGLRSAFSSFLMPACDPSFLALLSIGCLQSESLFFLYIKTRSSVTNSSRSNSPTSIEWVSRSGSNGVRDDRSALMASAFVRSQSKLSTAKRRASRVGS